MYSKRPKRKNVGLWKRIRYHFASCANICSIHGFAHVVRKNISPYERLLWFLLVTSAIAWCIELASQAWDRYQTRPTVISLERDHWKWNTTFPAVTLCLNEIDDYKADQLISELKSLEENDTDKFKTFLGALATAKFSSMDPEEYANGSLYWNVEQYVDWVIRAGGTLDNLVEIDQTFGELQQFQTILTEFGVCFAYNSRIAIYSSPEYWAKSTDKLGNANSTIVMINPSVLAPTLSITSLSCGYQIFFHGPNEIPELSTKGLSVGEATFAKFELTTTNVWTPLEVKSLEIRQRNCRLPEESNLKHSPVYSYNLCRMECRRRLCLKLCNCIPYYYRPSGSETICDINGMRCLHKHKGLLANLSGRTGFSTCSCSQNCDEDSVTITKYEITQWFLGTNVQLKVTQYPTIRYKRSLIFSRTNLLVQIGGVAGLFLGCSVLSLIELLYFLTLRFYWSVIQSRTI